MRYVRVWGYGYCIRNRGSVLRNFRIQKFLSGQLLSVQGIIDIRPGRGDVDVRCVRGVWLVYG